MPALSPTMEKGNLAKWLKKEGDAVKTGDVIAEIETDKATMEYEAVDDGVLAKIVVPEGTNDVPVNQLIAVMAQEGEDVKAAAARRAGQRRPAPEPPHPHLLPLGEKELPSKLPRLHPRRLRKRRKLHRRRQRRALPLPSGERVGVRGFGPTVMAPAANRVFSSPLARRLAKEAGIDIGRIQGTGPHGRVIARDVATAKAGRRLARAGRAPRAPRAADRAVDVGPADPRALRRRQLRGRAARRHAPHHRAAADRLGADHSAFLSHRRLRHRQASRRARGDQRHGAEGQGRQAGLQAFGQRFRHQGAGAGAAARAGRQCELDRSRHAQAQAFRRRRRGGDAERSDHADHPQCRDQIAVRDLQRDARTRGARPRRASSNRTNIRAAPRRCRTSACTASRISPR